MKCLLAYTLPKTGLRKRVYPELKTKSIAKPIALRTERPCLNSLSFRQGFFCIAAFSISSFSLDYSLARVMEAVHGRSPLMDERNHSVFLGAAPRAGHHPLRMKETPSLKILSPSGFQQVFLENKVNSSSQTRGTPLYC